MFFYIVLATVIFLGYLYVFKYNHKIKYWEKYNIPYYGGRFGLGTIWEFFAGSQPLYIINDEIYKKYPGAPAIAIGPGYRPQIIMTNLDNIQHVLAGDFNSFNHRGIEVNADVDPLADNVLFMNRTKWKLTRQKMTPLFTSAKLRNMYYIMNKSAQDFVVYLKDNNKKEDAFDTLTTFCAAAISASVFGISGDKSTMDTPFLEMAREATNPTFVFNLKFILAVTAPKLFSIFNIQLFQKYEKMFIGSMKQVFKARKEANVNTHDFASLCVDVQKQGTMKDPNTGLELEPTDELLSAQAFFFYTAGIEPSATSIFFTLFELAKNSEILKKVHREIDEVFERNNGEISHEDAVNMEYIEMAMDEAMRLHPPAPTVLRKCIQESVLPVSKVCVKENTSIIIPIYSIHHDPKYYPNPEVYDPERFSAEAKQNRPNYTFMPFGDGNRTCLGMRFARLQVKIGLIYLLRHYTVTVKSTKVKYIKGPILMRPVDMDIDFVERKCAKK